MAELGSIEHQVERWFTDEVVKTIEDFQNPRQEWRRLVAELLGTFLLVVVAAGAPMVGVAFPGSISRAAAVVAPGLVVMALILAIGKVAGAHLNPVVSLAFALRGDFPWRRVPGYLVAQLAGALAAVGLLQWVVGVSATFGSTLPGRGVNDARAVAIEAMLTFGLVTVILGTASGAQNVGMLGALGVGGYIALAGLWASPLTGASMNPVRSLAPELVGTDLAHWWVYLAGPLGGAVLAVGVGFLLRGRGGGVVGSTAAQGALHPEVSHPEPS